MQMKFAQELVPMKVERLAHNVLSMQVIQKKQQTTGSVLQNPKLYPLVVKYIGELREEYQKKKYEVTLVVTLENYLNLEMKQEIRKRGQLR